MANARCTSATKHRHLLAKAAEQMSTPFTSHSEARVRRTMSYSFFPQGVTVVWEITHIYPLHVVPWQRSLPRSPGSQETPPQNRTKQYRNKYPILGQEATDIRAIQHRTRGQEIQGLESDKDLVIERKRAADSVNEKTSESRTFACS